MYWWCLAQGANLVSRERVYHADVRGGLNFLSFDTKPKDIVIPDRVKIAFFYSCLPYSFTNDLFVIWITIHFGNFEIAGIYFGASIISQMLVSYLVGYYSDRGKIMKIFYTSVALSVVFWLLVPFATTILIVFILQSTIGMLTLAVGTPAERGYYSITKASGEELSFSFARERYIQLGLLVRGVFTLIAVLLVKVGSTYLCSEQCIRWQ